MLSSGMRAIASLHPSKQFSEIFEKKGKWCCRQQWCTQWPPPKACGHPTNPNGVYFDRWTANTDCWTTNIHERPIGSARSAQEVFLILRQEMKEKTGFSSDGDRITTRYFFCCLGWSIVVLIYFRSIFSEPYFVLNFFRSESDCSRQRPTCSTMHKTQLSTFWL